MLAFANALVDHRLLDAKNTALITTQKVAAPGGGYGYGFGIRRVGGQPPTIWHNGGAPGAAGEIDINPRLGTTVITLANVGPPSVFPIVDFVLNTLRVP